MEREKFEGGGCVFGSDQLVTDLGQFSFSLSCVQGASLFPRTHRVMSLSTIEFLCPCTNDYHAMEFAVRFVIVRFGTRL